MNRIKFIYWFAHFNLNSPSIRYRAKYPLDFAREELGVESQLVIPGYSLKQIFLFLKAYIFALLFGRNNSLIVIQRVRSNFIYSNLLKILVLLRRKNTIYDLDDADYLQYDPETIHFFARKCSFISAGSSEIANYFCQFNKNVYKTTSPVFDMGIEKQKRNDLFTIGWVGGYKWGHRESLFEFVFSSIRELPFKCRLVILGVTDINDENEIREYFRGHPHIHIETPRDINWNNETELQMRIVQFDVGVATLSNHETQLAKSGIKVKQYLNNGIPVICNNLPENNNVVINGHNGYICNTPEEFTLRFIEFKEMCEEEYAGFSISA